MSGSGGGLSCWRRVLVVKVRVRCCGNSIAFGVLLDRHSALAVGVLRHEQMDALLIDAIIGGRDPQRDARWRSTCFEGTGALMMEA